MTEKNFLFRFPEPKALRALVGQDVDQETKTVIPKYETYWISAIQGVIAAFRQTNVLQQHKFDLFDVQDFRRELTTKIDTKHRVDFDDKFLVVTETQRRMVETAVKHLDWTFPEVQEGVVRSTNAWIDWFAFFDAIRNPVEFNPNAVPEDYATWSLAKTKRLAAEKAEEEAKATAQAAPAPEPKADPVAVNIPGEVKEILVEGTVTAPESEASNG